MQFNRLTYGILIIAIGFSACTKEINLSDDYQKQLPVVHCLFTTDSSWRVKLTESQYVLDNSNYSTINDAMITLYDGNYNFLNIFNSLGEGVYELSEPLPQQNTGYNIRINTEKHEDIEASSYVPKVIEGITIDTFRIEGTSDIQFTVMIPDNLLVDNFYGVRITRISYYIDPVTLDSIRTKAPLEIISTNHFVANGISSLNEIARTAKQFYFSDEHLAGETISFSGRVSNQNHLLDTVYYSVDVNHYSIEAYKYLLSVERYFEAKLSNFPQPVQIPSNFENGLGCFGGFTQFNRTFLFK